MNQALTQFMDETVAIIGWLLKAGLALLPIALAVGPVLFPLIAGWFRNQKHGQAFATVSRMGLLATNAAADEIRKGMAEATSYSSPGGITITQAEMAAILARAAGAAFQWAKEEHALKQVLDVYGGEEAVKASIAAIVTTKLQGNPVGEASTTRAVPPK